MSNKNLITFLDAAQRTIIGELVKEEENSIQVKNPVIVNIVPQTDQSGRPTGGMALQLVPAFFKEFQADKKSDVLYTYNTNNITRIEFEGGFDFRLYGQYEHLFKMAAEPNNAPAPVEAPKSAPVATNNPPVIKLFDDEETDNGKEE